VSEADLRTGSIRRRAPLRGMGAETVGVNVVRPSTGSRIAELVAQPEALGCIHEDLHPAAVLRGCSPRIVSPAASTIDSTTAPSPGTVGSGGSAPQPTKATATNAAATANATTDAQPCSRRGRYRADS